MPKYLPSATKPWRIPIARRHIPPTVRGKEGFKSYRPCLRWEFGFSCAFCLLHEVDLFAAGIEGTALTWVEHHVPKSRLESGRNHYENCFYSCRFCNSAHGALPVVDPEGNRLLDPCRVAWGAFFELRDDELRPRDEGDAAYTHRTYDLDEPRKMKLRKARRETLAAMNACLSQGRQVHDRLLERARDTADSSLVDLAQEAWELFELAGRQREHLVGIPQDADLVCACGHDRNCSLPEVLFEQLE